MTVGTLLAKAREDMALKLSLPANEAGIEARLLLCRALGKVSRAWLITHENDPVSEEARVLFASLLARRLEGEPVAYILGVKEFWGLEFEVNAAVLIPRPETELLVELAIEKASECARILDLGTGSGAVAVSLAHARRDAQVLAADKSPDALAVAKRNAAKNLVANISFVESDWFENLADEKFDLVVSNPPYVAEGDPHLADLLFEPEIALVSGPDGMDDIRKIVSSARGHLKPGGWLLFEHGFNQAAICRQILGASGFSEIFSARDLAGIERLSGGRLTA